MKLIDQIASKALSKRIPLSVQMDLTWVCNEGCEHCYLEHRAGGELNTSEVKRVLDELAEAGTLFLTFSGGEIMLRKDIFEIVGHARSLLFDVRLKTNGILIGPREAERFARMSVRSVDISIYSHRPEVHDAITRVPGSLERSLAAVRLLKSHGMRVRMSCTLMKSNVEDYPHVQALARELGVEGKFDPTMMPRINGDHQPISLRVPLEDLERIYRDPRLVLDAEEYCAAPPPPSEKQLNGHSCGAGLDGCHISPRGDVMPCVQFPAEGLCGNLRTNSFSEVWRDSPMFATIRATKIRDLPTCGTCANVSACHRCAALAMRDGDLLGPSHYDCERTYARTHIPPPLVQLKDKAPRLDYERAYARMPIPAPQLVQIHGAAL
jgi:radical SAM protein with 4Fe4S-binding SPASM domain